MTSPELKAKRPRRGQLLFRIEVDSTTPDRKARKEVVSYHGSLDSAFTGLIAILGQWQASCGAIAVGTKVMVKDMRDSGIVVCMEYLGFEENTLIGR